ncbi:uncharacterized protein LOC134674985 [Cydia fagiglandana]|uniref:uncharacterized protein LOC134674985 n=1 Tax=Cydia fagiglandana TaxID=1458189 RepID=UPI002FEE6103
MEIFTSSERSALLGLKANPPLCGPLIFISLYLLLRSVRAKIGRTDGDNHLRNTVGKFGLGTRNERGEMLLDFCAENQLTVMNTWFQQHPRRLYTWTSPNGLYRNQIDFILISQRWRSSICATKTRPGADCGSDHQLLAAKFRVRLKSAKRETLNKPIRLNTPALEMYKERISNRLAEAWQDPLDAPESTWASLKSAMLEVAKQASEKNKAAVPRAEWISADTWSMIEKRKTLKEGGLCSDADRKRYANLHSTIQKLCRKDREVFIGGICADIEKCSETAHSRDMFQKVKILTNEFKPKHWTIESNNGTPLMDKTTILERWRGYCQQLYCDNNTLCEEEEYLDYAEREPDILLHEVESAIRKLKHKACGSDGVTTQMIQNLGPEGVNIIHTICLKVWRTGQWPEDWTESSVVPLHKKGSTRKCENYRTISLISHASKILLHILNKRLESFIARQIPQEQAGFVRGRGTREQILNIRLVIEKCREHNISAAMCFIDYAKAFDCISWKKMFEVMSEMGVPDHLTFLVQNLYLSGRSRVRIGECVSEPFQSERGVRQGCILSPQLFNLIGEHIMRRVLENQQGGIRIGGYLLNNLWFADDTTIIASTEAELADILDRIDRISAEYGLLINRSKTKLMFVNRSGHPQRTNELRDLDSVRKFVYLGSQISDDGDCDQEIVRRGQMAKAAVKRLEKIWRNRGINRKTKIKLMHTLIFSIFLYASETWTLKARALRRIDAFEMWCWRRMLNISWTERRTNESILKELKITTRLSTICTQRVLKFFGHTVRRGTDTLESNCTAL